jgi:hypothetical protein
MPPTSDAPHFHMQRAFHQAKIWHTANVTLPDIMDPTSPGAGWKDGNEGIRCIERRHHSIVNGSSHHSVV